MEIQSRRWMADPLKKCKRIVLLLTLCLFCGACFSSQDAVAPAEAEHVAQQQSGVAAPPEILDRAAPISLEVVEERNDGGSLYVVAKVTANTRWPTAAASLRLTGLHNGSVSGQITKPLSDGVVAAGGAPPDNLFLEAGEARLLALSLPAQNITDYQLEISWDKAFSEKASSAASLPTAIEAKDAESHIAAQLRNVGIVQDNSRCAGLPCEVSYRVSGEVYNAGSDVLERAKLGVGFVWRNAGTALEQSAAIPQNEETVEIAGLTLTPGASKAFTLAIERLVPLTQAGGFEPVVRIVP